MSRKIMMSGMVIGLVLLTITANYALAQIRDLSAEELRQRLDQVVVVDVRSAQEYSQKHIRGAINISSQASHQFRAISSLLPDDKKTPLVFYCRNYN